VDVNWPREICENFLYGFKGAQSAPRELAAAHTEAPRAAHRLPVTG
jgi:hypothetical protein